MDTLPTIVTARLRRCKQRIASGFLDASDVGIFSAFKNLVMELRISGWTSSQSSSASLAREVEETAQALEQLARRMGASTPEATMFPTQRHVHIVSAAHIVSSICILASMLEFDAARATRMARSAALLLGPGREVLAAVAAGIPAAGQGAAAELAMDVLDAMLGIASLARTSGAPTEIARRVASAQSFSGFFEDAARALAAVQNAPTAPVPRLMSFAGAFQMLDSDSFGGSTVRQLYTMEMARPLLMGLEVALARLSRKDTLEEGCSSPYESWTLLAAACVGLDKMCECGGAGMAQALRGGGPRPGGPALPQLLQLAAAALPQARPRHVPYAVYNSAFVALGLLLGNLYSKALPFQLAHLGGECPSPELLPADWAALSAFPILTAVLAHEAGHIKRASRPEKIGMMRALTAAVSGMACLLHHARPPFTNEKLELWAEVCWEALRLLLILAVSDGAGAGRPRTVLAALICVKCWCNAAQSQLEGAVGGLAGDAPSRHGSAAARHAAAAQLTGGADLGRRSEMISRSTGCGEGGAGLPAAGSDDTTYRQARRLHTQLCCIIQFAATGGGSEDPSKQMASEALFCVSDVLAVCICSDFEIGLRSLQGPPSLQEDRAGQRLALAATHFEALQALHAWGGLAEVDFTATLYRDLGQVVEERRGRLDGGRLLQLLVPVLEGTLRKAMRSKEVEDGQECAHGTASDDERTAHEMVLASLDHVLCMLCRDARLVAAFCTHPRASWLLEASGNSLAPDCQYTRLCETLRGALDCLSQAALEASASQPGSELAQAAADLVSGLEDWGAGVPTSGQENEAGAGSGSGNDPLGPDRQGPAPADGPGRRSLAAFRLTLLPAADRLAAALLPAWPPPAQLAAEAAAEARAVAAHRSGCSNLRCPDWLGAGKLRKCGRCLTTRYCSPECQRADWRAGHRLACTVLAREAADE